MPGAVLLVGEAMVTGTEEGLTAKRVGAERVVALLAEHYCLRMLVGGERVGAERVMALLAEHYRLRMRSRAPAGLRRPSAAEHTAQEVSRRRCSPGFRNCYTRWPA